MLRRTFRTVTTCVLVVTLGLFFAGTACGSGNGPDAVGVTATTRTEAAEPTPPAFPVTVAGSDGTSTTFDRPPERIVAFDSAAVEILFTLGEQSRIIATHEYVTYPSDVEGIPKVGDAFNVNLEKIAQLKPDLVYIFFDRFVPDLRKLGVPVLYVESATTLEQVGDQMRMWGRILGRTAAGEELGRGFESGLDAVVNRVGEPASTPKVYLDISPMLWTLGAGSLGDEMVTRLKAVNIFAEVGPAAQVSAEQILDRGPDAIISTYEGGAAQFTADAVYASVPAVVAGHVCEVDGSLVSAPGPRLTEGIEAIARCVYPERFH